MNAPSPSIKTLLEWATLAESGGASDALAAWLQATPEASAHWFRVQEALGRLRRGEPTTTDPLLPVDLVARYVDGRCDPQEATGVEETCWSSAADLVEVLSALRFAAEMSDEFLPPSDVDSADSPLSARLLALVPDSSAAAPMTLPITNAVPAVFPTAIPAALPTTAARNGTPRWRTSESPSDTATSHDSPTHWPTVREAPVVGRHSRPRKTPLAAWSYAFAGAVVVLVVLGTVAWRFSGERQGDAPGPGVAHEKTESNDRQPSPDAPKRSTPRREPARNPNPRESLANDDGGRPAERERPQRRPDRESPESLPPTRRPGADLVQMPDTPDARVPEKSAPPRPRPTPMEPVRPEPERPAPVLVALRSELGATLVPGPTRGSWRVGRGEQPLTAPLSLVSLADSWTTADIPGVGTLVLDGEAFATVSLDPDRTVRVALDQGRVGVRDLAENAKIRFEAAGQKWEANGVGDYSTFAVVRDVEAPSMFVTSGIIAVGAVKLGGGEVSELQQGVAKASESLSRRGEAAEASPFMPNAYDERWLRSPDDRRRKEWQATYGKLVERLAAADDVTPLFAELRSSARDGRQHALLARWNLSLAENRGAALWEMLGDRQRFVRLAAARELLATPPRDGRLRAYFNEIRESAGVDTAGSLLEWVGRSHRTGPILPAQANELVEGLAHPELAMRQMAALLLEYHLRDALVAVRARAPTYDPEDSAGRRTLAQAQWKAIVAQIFANRARNGRAEAPK